MIRRAGFSDRFNWFALLLCAGLMWASPGLGAVLTPFSVRFTANDTGNIAFAANTLMTAPASDPDAANAQNGVGSKLSNNDFQMTYVDVDNDPTTFNSSFARLSLPSGSQVLFAGLYWGARTNTTFPTGLTKNRPFVKFKSPGDSAYRDLTGTVVGTGGSDYQSFVDVTAIVQGGGAGAYAVANVQAVKDASDYYAGWSMVVVYRAPGAPARNLTVFDGYGIVRSSDSSIDINVSGFVTPPSGPVNATLGFIAYEGDLGYTGDRVFFDGGLGPVQLSNTANPPNNFFNSTISDRSALVSTKDPNYVNQLGFDADLVTADSIIANGASSAKIRMTTGGETYYPGVVTSVIELFAPEVQVVKSVQDLNGGTVLPGDVLRYTVTVSNQATAQDNAVDVILNDLIPVSTTYDPGSLEIDHVAKTDAVDGDQAELINGNAVRFQLGTGAGGVDAYGTPRGGVLIPGQNTTITFQVVVNSGIGSDTLISNTATANYSGATSLIALTATDSADIAGSDSADLAVTKDNGQNSYVPGAGTTYTIVVSNNGPSDLTGSRGGISVVDVLPNEISTASWSATYAGSGSSGPLTGTGNINALINLAVGGTATFTINAQTRSEAFGNLANTVVVNPPAGVVDPDQDNNTATDIDVVSSPVADLRVSKTVNNSSPQVGDSVQFTMSVFNDGPSQAGGVVLTDVLPTGFTWVSSSPSGGTTYDVATGLWNVGTLANGGSATLVLVATVNPSGNYLNDVIVSESDVLDPDPTNNSASISVFPTSADLSVTKSVDNPSPPVGGAVQFSINLNNHGPSAATNVTVADVLPTGYTLVGFTASTGTTYNNATGDWTVGTLASGTTANLRINATVNASGSYVNTASVSHSDQPDPDPSNNSSSVTTGPISADLAVSKQVDIANPSVGDAIQFLMVVTNQGPGQATGVTLVDQLPSGYTFNSAKASGAGTYSASSGQWTVGTLAKGESATLRLNATVRGGGNYLNQVAVTHSDQPDPLPGNEMAEVAIGPISADLAVTKQVDQAHPAVGDTVQFVIAVTNNGPSRATHVRLVDNLPSGYQFTSATPGATFDASSGQWSVDELASGATATLRINAVVLGTGSYENSVAVSASDQPDPDSSNNTSSVSTGPISADLVVSKQVDNPSPEVGARVQFLVVATNRGPNQATGVMLLDNLPSGFAFDRAEPSTGTRYDAISGQWNVGTLARGSSATLRINAIVLPRGSYRNTTVVSYCDQPDPDASNNRAEVAVGPVTADLVVTKQVNNPTPPVGSQVVFTMAVTNQGPNTATNVNLVENLPSGYSLVGATATAGTSYDPVSGEWMVGFLPPSGTATLQITATVNSTGDHTNTVSVSHSDQPGSDSATLKSTVNTGPQSADIAVTKGVDNPAPYIGDTVQFTIGVVNQGPNDTSDLNILDNLPSGYGFVSASASKGNYDASSGQWTVGSLANGARESLIIRAVVNGSGAYTNSAMMSYSAMPDPDATNNTSSIAVVPQINPAPPPPPPPPNPIPTLGEWGRSLLALMLLGMVWQRRRVWLKP